MGRTGYMLWKGDLFGSWRRFEDFYFSGQTNRGSELPLFTFHSSLHFILHSSLPRLFTSPKSLFNSLSHLSAI